MFVLVLNSGSSSLKYQLIDIETEQCLTKGLVEKIGGKEAIFSYEAGNSGKLKEVHALHDHQEALNLVLKSLVSGDAPVISDVNDITAVGHRVVHGGERFTESVIVTEDVIKSLRDCIELAPLHNPANIQGIDVCLKLLPKTPQVAVFDTAFHQTMPDYAYLYGLPYVMYTRHRVRRYGFHGSSHRYVVDRAAEILGKPLKNLKLVSCHLGNGSSVCAVENGRSVDTSMGFTPLEGLIMGTRSGDLDPAIIPYLMQKDELSVYEMNSMLNKHSGLLGISGSTNDLRELFELRNQKDTRAELAINMLVYRLKKYIGSYLAVLGGADAVIFTAGIGENNPFIRENALDGMEFMGVKIDRKKNKNASGEADISAADSAVKVLVIPTNEELLIARDTARCIKKRK